MIGRDDIIAVRVDDEMIGAGVAYAEKSLHYTYNRMGLGSHYNRIRNIVCGIVMEEAFRRLLDRHKVKYNLLGRTHFTQKDRYDVGISGHRCDVKGFVIKDEDRLAEIRKDVGWFLDCSALVPADQVEARSLQSDDIYVFPFAIVAADGSALKAAPKSHWMHSFWEYDWFKNKTGTSLGRITVMSKAAKPVHLRLGGQDNDEEFQCEEVLLVPGTKAVSMYEYYTLLFLQAHEPPAGELKVYCQKLEKQETVSDGAWEDVWIHFDRVYFAGLITKGEFRKRSIEIPRFYKKCKQYDETKTVNRTMLIRELYPLKRILAPVLARGVK